jgi:4-amino-4-deoxy-L-arabinose transferase-like glycosyltransferase
VHSKILLHDLPTAALSAFAFLAFLKWYRSENVLWLAAIAVLLAAGFLAKGPFVFVVFCSGITALICLEPESRMLILRRKNAIAATTLASLGLSALWFIHVYLIDPTYTVDSYYQELSARQIGKINLQPLESLSRTWTPWQFLSSVPSGGMPPMGCPWPFPPRFFG